MKALLAIFFCAIVCGSVFGAETVIFTIDDFLIESAAIFIVTNGTNPQRVENFVDDGSILGGERDLQLTSLTGSNQVISASVAGGTFNSAAPKGSTGFSLLQYDGNDGYSTLDPTGLDDFDFTASSAFAFRTNITADLPTNVIFRVYSGSASNFCSFTIPIPGNGIPAIYTLNYASFVPTGSGCDFTSVGALEIVAELEENVDIVIDNVVIVALLPTPSASITPTISTTPSPSRPPPTPSATPTPSRIPPTPSATPSPSSCLCTCPELECYMFKVGEYSFIGDKARNVHELALPQEEEGFDFLKFF